MAYCHNSFSAIWCCFSLTLVIVTVQVEGDRLNRCSTSIECPGPVEHYKALRCTPVYKEDSDCCPWRYDCDHLHDVIYKNKCLLYYSTHEYKIGERIREEDANLCEKNCICKTVLNDFADFNCATRKAFCPSFRHSRRGCYKGQFIQCCPEVNVCSSVKPGGCMEDGKSYLPGDMFVPENDSNTLCKCKETKHENTFEPSDKNLYSLVHSSRKTHKFECASIRMTTYAFECFELNYWFDQNPELAYYKNCAPVYPFHKSDTTIRQTWRCQNANDSVTNENLPGSNKPAKSLHVSYTLPAVHCPLTTQKEYNDYIFRDGGCLLINPDGSPEVEYGLEYRQLCRLGQNTMRIGEQLNNIAYGNDSYIRCICNVPPVLTCLLMSRVSKARSWGPGLQL